VSAPLRIANARQLLEALQSSQTAVVLGVHKTLRKHAQKALAFGQHEGQDAVDMLLSQALEGDTQRQLLARASLSVFADERVVRFFLERLENGRGSTLLEATAYLMANRQTLERAQLYGALLQNLLPQRARAAGHILGGPEAGDPTPVCLRLALLQPTCSLPPFEGAWERAWRAELTGVLARETRAALGTLGEEVLSKLALNGPPEERLWLVDWALRLRSPLSLEMLEGIPAGPLLSCLERHAPLSPDLREALAGLLEHSQPQVRLRALQLGAPMKDPETLLVTHGASPHQLAELLEDADWRVRAAASEALVASGEMELVKARIHSPRPEVRAAAAQILSALGQELWLEENLLEP